MTFEVTTKEYIKNSIQTLEDEQFVKVYVKNTKKILIKKK